MSIRTYLFIGLIMGGIVFLVSTFFDTQIVAWAEAQQYEAAIRSQRVLELMVFEPFIFVMGTRPWGPIVAGLAWPAIFVWLLLLLMSLLIITGVDVTRDIEAVT